MKSRFIILTSQKDKNGECKIYLEFETKKDGKRKRKRKPTDVWVKPRFWSKTKQSILAGDPSFLEKNELLRSFHRIYRDDDPFKSRNTVIEPNGLIEWMERYITFRKSLGKKRSSFKEFITVKNRMKRFQKDSDYRLEFIDINIKFSDDLILWLAEQEYDPNTMKKHFSTFKTFLYHYYSRQADYGLVISKDFQSKEFGK
ncbi:MAG: phage integrase SAM-like domain-containing protein, partial [Bacteroidota bacterium]